MIEPHNAIITLGPDGELVAVESIDKIRGVALIFERGHPHVVTRYWLTHGEGLELVSRMLKAVIYAQIKAEEARETLEARVAQLARPSCAVVH